MITALQIILVLGCIYAGVRMKGIGLGLMGALGTLLLVFVFGLEPSKAPIDVMLIIVTVILASGAMQAAGGIDLLLFLAEKILRSNPRFITLLGPVVTYLFTLFAGTSHIIYGLLPVIAEVSIHKRIRPERAMSMSVIASHLAITASPVSAATAALAALIEPKGFGLEAIFTVCIPATFLGSLVGVLFMWNKGKSWDKDPVLQQYRDPEHITPVSYAGYRPDRKARLSVLVFALAVIAVSVLGVLPGLRPHFPDATGVHTPLAMPLLIEMVMFSAAALILLLTRVSPAHVSGGSVFRAGMEAMVSIFGVVWLTDTFIHEHMDSLQAQLSGLVSHYPFLFVGALFILSAIIFSQASTTRALMPLGIALGIPVPYLLAMFPAVNGDFVIPGYPTLLAAANFDRTGSTRFGKFLFDHSFMLPGLVSIAATVIIGFALSFLV